MQTRQVRSQNYKTLQVVIKKLKTGTGHVFYMATPSHASESVRLNMSL